MDELRRKANMVPLYRFPQPVEGATKILNIEQTVQKFKQLVPLTPLEAEVGHFALCGKYFESNTGANLLTIQRTSLDIGKAIGEELNRLERNGENSWVEINVSVTSSAAGGLWIAPSRIYDRNWDVNFTGHPPHLPLPMIVGKVLHAILVMNVGLPFLISVQDEGRSMVIDGSRRFARYQPDLFHFMINIRDQWQDFMNTQGCNNTGIHLEAAHDVAHNLISEFQTANLRRFLGEDPRVVYDVATSIVQRKLDHYRCQDNLVKIYQKLTLQQSIIIEAKNYKANSRAGVELGETVKEIANEEADDNIFDSTPYTASDDTSRAGAQSRTSRSEYARPGPETTRGTSRPREASGGPSRPREASQGPSRWSREGSAEYASAEEGGEEAKQEEDKPGFLDMAMHAASSVGKGLLNGAGLRKKGASKQGSEISASVDAKGTAADSPRTVESRLHDDASGALPSTTLSRRSAAAASSAAEGPSGRPRRSAAPLPGTLSEQAQAAIASDRAAGRGFDSVAAIAAARAFASAGMESSPEDGV